MPGILVSGTNGPGNYSESFFKVQCCLCSGSMVLPKCGKCYQAKRHHNPGNHNLTFLSLQVSHIVDSTVMYETLCKIAYVFDVT